MMMQRMKQTDTMYPLLAEHIFVHDPSYSNWSDSMLSVFLGLSAKKLIKATTKSREVAIYILEEIDDDEKYDIDSMEPFAGKSETEQLKLVEGFADVVQTATFEWIRREYVFLCSS